MIPVIPTERDEDLQEFKNVALLLYFLFTDPRPLQRSSLALTTSSISCLLFEGKGKSMELFGRFQ